MGTQAIAIDGPAGSGKSTTAREVAQRLGWLYVDTGAMYRAFALKAIRSEVDLDDAAALEGLVRDTEIGLLRRNDRTAVILDGEDVSHLLRSEEVGRAASRVATVSAVRRRMVEIQRKIARGGRVVMEGRDTTTVVLPDAALKVYLTASLPERAKRRKLELGGAADGDTLERMVRDLAERDRRDESRRDSPLRMADGAFVLDTTGLSIEEQVERVMAEAKRLGITGE